MTQTELREKVIFAIYDMLLGGDSHQEKDPKTTICGIFEADYEEIPLYSMLPAFSLLLPYPGAACRRRARSLCADRPKNRPDDERRYADSDRLVHSEAGLHRQA